MERSAWEQIQAGTLTVETALAVQRAVTAFAAESGQPRFDVEMALKRLVRHPEPEAA
ncbi:hypothetical protein [Streptomyces sp. AcE210]|uniref:hypothetical protein n=1 Tax=Streptomyces sp. AcE210 TaxID=2292703 RepID=UPI0014051691|nr:hypothetical protein [Streptomyces sp. AcE210]